MKTFLYLLLALLFISCNQTGNKNVKEVRYSDTIDTIQLVNDFDPDFDFCFSYTDYFGDNIDLSKIGKAKNVLTETPYFELRQLFVNQPFYWLRKGETYHITGENNRLPIFWCKNETLMNEVTFFNKLYETQIDLNYDWTSPDWQQIKKELDENIHHLKAKERYEKKLAYLEEQKQKVSPLFYDLCTHFFKIDYLDKLFYSYRRNKSDEIVKKILLDQKDSIQHDDLFFSKLYKDFCLTYCYFLFENDSDSSAYRRYSIIKDNFKGKIRDYLLFRTIQFGEPDENQLTTFYNDCLNEAYKDYIKQERRVKAMLQSANDTLFRPDLSRIGLSDILSKYKGKWIYMDFWASWCAPCRALLPLSLKWKEQYAKDIVFIYVSIDENSNQWQKAIKGENLDENYCFLLSKNSDFIITHKIKTIPRYMLFDRNGILIDDNALRPDDSQWSKKIDKIVNTTNKIK